LGIGEKETEKEVNDDKNEILNFLLNDEEKEDEITKKEDNKHDAIAFELGLAQNMEDTTDDQEEVLWASDDNKYQNNDENIWGLTLPQDRASLMKGI
jgi:hypothetical protein